MAHTMDRTSTGVTDSTTASSASALFCRYLFELVIVRGRAQLSAGERKHGQYPRPGGEPVPAIFSLLAQLAMIPTLISRWDLAAIFTSDQTREDFEQGWRRAYCAYRDGDHHNSTRISKTCLAEFERFVLFSENKTWRFAYEDGYLLFYGDPSDPHQTAIHVMNQLWYDGQEHLPARYQQLLRKRVAGLGQSAAKGYGGIAGNRKEPNAAWYVLHDRSSGACPVVLEVAWNHESRAELLREPVKWSQTGGVKFAIGIRIKQNDLETARYDSYISLYLLDVAQPHVITEIDIGCGSENIPPLQKKVYVQGGQTIEDQYPFDPDNDRMFRKKAIAPEGYQLRRGQLEDARTPLPVLFTSTSVVPEDASVRIPLAEMKIPLRAIMLEQTGVVFTEEYV